MQQQRIIIAGLLAGSLLMGCSTNTYVSNENTRAFEQVNLSKFVIEECRLFEPEVRVAMASHFAFDSAALTQVDQDAINAFIKQIKSLRGQITIIGHTDIRGSKAYNLALSDRRARSVEKHLRQRVNERHYQWRVKYYGKARPVNASVHPEAHAQNRRAYIIFEQTRAKQNQQSACPPINPERKVSVAITPHFDFDQAALTPSSSVSLNEFAERIAGLKGRILIAGHTDSQGSDDYNLKLAKARAYSVRDYLTTRLVAEDYQWQASAFGENALLSDENTPDDHSLNRRAVIMFTQF